MAHIELGYKPSNTLVVGIPLHENSYMTWEKRSTYLDRLSEAIAEIPGVQSAAISTMATPPASGLDERVEVMGQVDVAEKQIRLNLVSSDYFGVLGMQLFNGRIWDHAESIRGANVAVVNQAMVRQYWPNGGAVGHSLRMPDMKGSPFQTTITQLNGWFEIIGVVADARNDGLVDPVQPAVYVPYAVFMDTYTHILVHTSSSPHSFFRAIREKVQGVDPEQQVEREAISLQDLISQQDEWKESELAARLLTIFGALALVLAAIGLYSVVSYIVVQRTKEIGIRMALGAQRADVMKSVFVSASLAVGIGLVTGSVVSLAFGKVLSIWVEIDSRDPVALAGSAAVLLVTSVLACLLPGQRACNLDPMEALRSE
jgi:predicted permease